MFSKNQTFFSQKFIELNTSFKIYFAEKKEIKLHIPGYGLSQKAGWMKNHNNMTFDSSDRVKKKLD
jgi:hypothetical protein